MSAVTIRQMADRVSELMEEKLAVRGKGLSAKLRRGGGRLPRKVRAAGWKLAEAAHNARNPKLLLQIDEAEVADAYDTCVRHLGGLTPQSGSRSALVGILSSIALSLMLLAAITAAILYWRGFLG